MSEARIGKFDILSPIGAGGMADVYRCRLRGPGGFEKIVVVKRIRGERASDPCFVNMFLDEARLAGGLNHPNIVQVFEIGEADGLPYIAMEYVKGPTLSALLREARRAGPPHPGHVARVLADVCEGLHHAHTALGPTGQPLGLVHRDVSPQNVMVSREGRAKLLDFGVAKASGRLTDTLAGTLKGKLRYMAPEQLSGQVDHRADVFAVGVCLFEATTGQNPYGPPTLDELALFHNIGAGKYRRPSQLVPDYPGELEAIVLSAIEPDPARRCGSARELQDRLERFASREPFAASTRAIAEWVRALFPDPEDAAPPVRPLPPADSGHGRRRRISPFNPLAAVLSPETGSFAALARRSPVVAPAAPLAPAPARPPRPAAVILAVALGSMVAGAAVWAVMQRGSAPRPSPITVAAISQPVPTLASDLLAAEAAEAYVDAAEKLTGGGQSASGRVLLGKARALAVKDPDLLRRMTEVERRLAEPPVQALIPAPARPSRRVRVPVPPPAAARAQDVRPTPPLLAAPAPPIARPAVVADRPAPVEPRDIYSARPLPHVPLPDLPRSYRAQGPEDLERMLHRVEQEAVRAGCSAPFSRGITDALYRALSVQPTPEIYPASLYYLIVNEAAVGREKQSASQQLAVAHRRGVAKALQNLPVARGVN